MFYHVYKFKEIIMQSLSVPKSKGLSSFTKLTHLLGVRFKDSSDRKALIYIKINL